ncbi:MAG: family transposase [Alphaproteobacteria bacterium]|nr:family transposase [Alphaproteobacteria bacterium]
MSVLSRPEFHSEEAAFAHLEKIIWADGKACPHCGGVDRITKVKANPAKRIRMGLWRCGDCKKQFTVKVGTVFEHARLPLNVMLQAVYLMTSSKKGVSAHQLHRTLEITYKSAWFLAHRIREAMREGDLAPFGSGGGFVEVDETYIGVDHSKPRHRQGYEHKFKVLALVDRNSGRTRMMHVEKVTVAHLFPILQANIAAEAHLLTDDAGQYRPIGKHFASHGTTAHTKGNYVDRENPVIHTQTVEGSFSIFKRGMKGVYQHCAEKHLHRYLAEFEFRYNHRIANGFDDRQRSSEALAGIVGKRILYRDSSSLAA